MGDDRRPHGADDPRITFYALLVGCAFAATYTTAGRVLRSLTRKARRTDRAAQALADLADSGPLVELLVRFVRGTVRIAAPLSAAVGGVLVVTSALLWGAGWQTVLCAVGYVLLSALAVVRPLKGALDWLVPPSSAPPNTSPFWYWRPKPM